MMKIRPKLIDPATYKVKFTSPEDQLSRDAHDASKNEILAIFNLGRCLMAQNDPTNSLEWIFKENPGFDGVISMFSTFKCIDFLK